MILQAPSPLCRYDDLHFAKEFVPCNGRKGGYEDVVFSKLTPLECLSLDFCLWAATCSARLDVTLELQTQWDNFKLAKSDQKVYKCDFVFGPCACRATCSRAATVRGRVQGMFGRRDDI